MLRRRESVVALLLVGLAAPTYAHRLDLVAAARDRGVSMTSTELFVPGRAETPHALRVSICATRSHAELERGLASLAELLRQSPEPCLAVA